jgi:hypothetical protein
VSSRAAEWEEGDTEWDGWPRFELSSPRNSTGLETRAVCKSLPLPAHRTFALPAHCQSNDSRASDAQYLPSLTKPNSIRMLNVERWMLKVLPPFPLL